MYNLFRRERVDTPPHCSFVPLELNSCVVTDSEGVLHQCVVSTPVSNPNDGLVYDDFDIEKLGFVGQQKLQSSSHIPPIQLDALTTAHQILSIPRVAFESLLNKPAQPAQPSQPSQPAQPAQPAEPA